MQIRIARFKRSEYYINGGQNRNDRVSLTTIPSVIFHNLIAKSYANRGFVCGTPQNIVQKQLQSLVEDGTTLYSQLAGLFSTGKSFKSEAKLLDHDIWLNISAGIMNENQAIIVATGITKETFPYFIVIDIFGRYY